jgi:Cu/Ag efflux protein CusF
MTCRDILGSLTLAASILFAVSVHAAELSLPGEPEIDPPAMESCDHAVPSDMPLAHGRIVAVDPKAARITLEFKPILPYLPEGGRHVFHVGEVDSLAGFRPGDKVRFQVERYGRAYTMTRIEHTN